MLNITFTPDWVSAVAAAVSCLFAIGYFVLLLVNALIIYQYFLATKEQAKAAWEMVGFAQKEFEPNVQIKFTEVIKVIDFGDFEGLVLSKEGKLTIPAKLKNLSKAASKFSIELDSFHTYISALIGTVKVDTYLINFQSKSWPVILKVGEEIDTPLLVLDIKSAFETHNYDFSNVNILKESTLSVAYNLTYPEGRDIYTEYWQIYFEGIRSLNTEGWLLLGKWLIIHREEIA